MEGHLRNRPALRLLAELAIIFLGVSAAFVADDLRESRNDKRAELSALGGFIQDLQNDSIALARTVAWTNRVVDAATELADFRERVTRPDPDSVRLALQMLGSAQPLFLTRATFDALRYSGRLDLIRDDELRGSCVAYFEAGQDNLRVVHELVVEIKFRDVDHAIAPHVRYGRPGESYGTAEVLTEWDQLAGESALFTHVARLGELAIVLRDFSSNMVQSNRALLAGIRSELESTQ